MCDGRDQLIPHPEPNLIVGPSRRQVLQGATLLGAALLVPAGGRLLRPVRALAAEPPAGLASVSSAMHLHASFSEEQGSWQSQLAEAQRCGIDVLWPTDHDWRMSAYTYIEELHFRSGEASNGSKVKYSFSTSGAAASASATLVTSPTSPDDPTGGALSVAVTSTGSAAASRLCLIGPSDLVASNLAGSTFTLRALPVQSTGDAWLEVRMNLSYHTSFGGRPAGIYQLFYRIGAVADGRSSQGLLGVVSIAAPTGQWSTLTLDPVSDIAALWPDLPEPRDNRMFGLWLGATSSNKAPASGYFAFAQFTRTLVTGNQPLDTQHDVLSTLAPLYPSVAIRPGLEISLNANHSNWFGGDFQMPQYPDLGTGDVRAKSMQLIHGYGGLGSINHPFGIKPGLASQSTQDTRRRKIAKTILGAKAFGADIIEAGYHDRGNASLESHLALWDTLSRNGLRLTGNGVSDNHVGTIGSWTTDKQRNTFATFIWAGSRSEADLLAGLSAGKVFCGEIGVWGGDIWIEVEGNPMGSIAVNPGASTRWLEVSVAGLQTGQIVEVVRGPVDYAGTAQADPGTVVVATLATGDTTVPIDTSTSCFVRTNVLDTVAKRRVAFSNPVWLLRQAPATAVPANRLGVG